MGCTAGPLPLPPTAAAEVSKQLDWEVIRNLEGKLSGLKLGFDPSKAQILHLS
jgi:hypothetical protein